MNVSGRAEHERIRDDLAAYALGALSDTEAADLEAHLARCEQCRARLEWLRPAVDVLPASVEQRQPPERLRESLLATVGAEAASASEPQGAEAAPRRAPRWRGFSSFALRPATGFAALLLVAAGIAGGYVLRGSNGGEPEPTFVEAEALGGQGELASATLERHGDSATLRVHEMPRLRRDEVYEVWIQRGGAMEPASTFVLRADGTADAAVPGPLEGGEAILVTKEPRPGTQQPSSPPLLRAPL